MKSPDEKSSTQEFLLQKISSELRATNVGACAFLTSIKFPRYTVSHVHSHFCRVLCIYQGYFFARNDRLIFKLSRKVQVEWLEKIELQSPRGNKRAGSRELECHSRDTHYHPRRRIGTSGHKFSRHVAWKICVIITDTTSR